MICGLQKLEKIPILGNLDDMENPTHENSTGKKDGFLGSVRLVEKKLSKIGNKENSSISNVVGGSKDYYERRPILSKQWRLRKCNKLKRLIFLSCLFQ